MVPCGEFDPRDVVSKARDALLLALRDGDDGSRAIARVGRMCTELIPVDGASISLMIDTDRREMLYASDEVVARIEALQFSLGEGPCFEAFETRRPVLVADLRATTTAWPIFAAEMAGQPVGAIFAFPLTSGAFTLGAMDLYRARPGWLVLDAFVQMADTLVDDYDIVDVLHELVSQSVRILDTAAAGIVMSDQRGGLQMLASSTEQAGMLELYQIQTDEGPCLDCVRSGEPVLVADLDAAADRWPVFVPRARSEGFAAVHAIPMRLRQETIGALNLFGRKPGAMRERDVRVARALADTATIGILQERAIHRAEVLTEQLQGALISRITIEQAKGVLAHAGRVDMDEAFRALRDYARRRSARLTEVARQLATGAIEPQTVLADRRPDGHPRGGVRSSQ